MRMDRIKAVARSTSGRALLFGAATVFLPVQETLAQLEEVVVTARRIEESIQDAPLAVAVMTNEYLQSQGVENMQDVLELTPGAAWNMYVKAQPAFTIRGINAGAFGNSSLETAAGFVQDGVPMTKVFMFVGDLYDVDRVEVMRGPQGTSFGRNSSLGLVHVVAARPEDEFGAGVNVEAGNLGLGGTNGYVTGPLSDTISGRLSWNMRDWDGAIEDAVTGEPQEYSEQRSIRGQLMIEPSDDFSAWLKLEYNDLDEGSTMRMGDLSPTENWLTPTAGPPPQGYLPQFANYTEDPSPWKGIQNCPPQGCDLQRQMTFLTAELVWNRPNGIAITSLSGYQDGDHEGWNDVFGTPAALQDQFVTNDATVISTELRVDNFAAGNRLSWLAGVYLLEDDEYRLEENIGNPERPDELGFYNCSGKLASCAGPSHLVNIGDASTSGLGLFGEITYDLTDQLTLVVGGRYSEDKRSYDYEVQGWGNTTGLGSVGLGEPTTDCVNNFVAVVDPDPRAGGFTCGTESNPMGFSQSLSRDFDNFSGKLSLSYAVNDNNNIYFLYSEGFKAGGYQHDARSRVQLNNGLVDEETADNFEFGWKGSYDNFRFAATLFTMEQQNAQINNLINVSTGFTTFVTNAGGVENTGFEFEGTWAVNDNFTVGGSFATYDAKLVNAVQGSALDVNTGIVAGEDISGIVPNWVPEETYTIYGDYRWQLANGSTIRLRADLRHRGENWGRAGANDRQTLTMDGTRYMFLRPELDKIGALISWTNAAEDITVELWGRNLDDDYDWINFGPGSPANYARGVLAPGVSAPPPAGTARPRGYGLRKQVGITARFLF
ncbi:MAG: TonB-dependent receptor [Gammaproteobacteria bacterium]|nr:TonB-dependent receptor [Gammaproteobacteria bacterium]